MKKILALLGIIFWWDLGFEWVKEREIIAISWSSVSRSYLTRLTFAVRDPDSNYRVIFYESDSRVALKRFWGSSAVRLVISFSSSHPHVRAFITFNVRLRLFSQMSAIFHLFLCTWKALSCIRLIKKSVCFFLLDCYIIKTANELFDQSDSFERERGRNRKKDRKKKRTRGHIHFGIFYSDIRHGRGFRWNINDSLFSFFFTGAEDHIVGEKGHFRFKCSPATSDPIFRQGKLIVFYRVVKVNFLSSHVC